MIGATVLVEELPGTGTTTNVYGYYSLSLEQGKYSISYQYVGYDPLTIEIDLSENISKDVEIGTGGLQIDEVVITAERADENVQSTKMSVTKLDPKDVELIPVLF